MLIAYITMSILLCIAMLQVDLQAMERAHRIGQTKPVRIYRMVRHSYAHTLKSVLVLVYCTERSDEHCALHNHTAAVKQSRSCVNGVLVLQCNAMTVLYMHSCSHIQRCVL